MEIGPHRLTSNVIAAPMAGVADRPFRQLCRAWGAGLAVSEMIVASDPLRDSRTTLRRADHAGEPRPVVAQIAGGDPASMADAARLNVERGADIIDINMGCPAKKVLRKLAGSALLEDEDLVARILESVVGAVSVPVTLKIRTGPEPGNRNGVRVAVLAESAGISAIAVHGRTRACKFHGAVEYRTIGRIKQAVSIPVVANGDIDTPVKAMQVLRTTGADGVMVGRAAQGRPWLFRQIRDYLASGTLFVPDSERQNETMLAHLRGLYGFYGEYMGVRVARKHLSWYLRDMPGGGRVWDAVKREESTSRQYGAVERWLGALAHGQTTAA